MLGAHRHRTTSQSVQVFSRISFVLCWTKEKNQLTQKTAYTKNRLPSTKAATGSPDPERAIHKPVAAPRRRATEPRRACSWQLLGYPFHGKDPTSPDGKARALSPGTNGQWSLKLPHTLWGTVSRNLQRPCINDKSGISRRKCSL